MDVYRLQVIIEVDEDGKYIASCPVLQGCYTQGDTFEEAMENIKDVIEMCVEELKEEDQQEESALSYADGGIRECPAPQTFMG